MKKYLLDVMLVTLFVLLISCGSRGQSQHFYQPHIGVWEDIDFEGRKAALVFRENGTGTILFDYNFYDHLWEINPSICLKL